MSKAATINIPIKVKRWKQKRGAWLVYSKKYQISGYGKTRKRAMEMFEFVVKDILSHTMSPMQRKYSKK
jgi:hypothetical protein